MVWISDLADEYPSRLLPSTNQTGPTQKWCTLRGINDNVSVEPRHTKKFLRVKPNMGPFNYRFSNSWAEGSQLIQLTTLLSYHIRVPQALRETLVLHYRLPPRILASRNESKKVNLNLTWAISASSSFIGCLPQSRQISTDACLYVEFFAGI